MNKCGIKHGFHDGTCIRERGHDGLCCSKAERMAGGAIMYSEWSSEDGEFRSHAGYRAFYPENAQEVTA